MKVLIAVFALLAGSTTAADVVFSETPYATILENSRGLCEGQTAKQRDALLSKGLTILRVTECKELKNYDFGGKEIPPENGKSNDFQAHIVFIR